MSQHNVLWVYPLARNILFNSVAYDSQIFHTVLTSFRIFVICTNISLILFLVANFVHQAIVEHSFHLETLQHTTSHHLMEEGQQPVQDYIQFDFHGRAPCSTFLHLSSLEQAQKRPTKCWPFFQFLLERLPSFLHHGQHFCAHFYHFLIVRTSKMCIRHRQNLPRSCILSVLTNISRSNVVCFVSPFVLIRLRL